jgi:RNA polymerase sigma factor (sigma-70 family)
MGEPETTAQDYDERNADPRRRTAAAMPESGSDARLSHDGSRRHLRHMTETQNHALQIEELFAAHERRLGQFLVQITDRELAEDILQETFLAVLREGDRLARVENVEAWLFAVARKRALVALRSRRRRLALWTRVAKEPAAAVDDPAAAVAVRDVLERHCDPDERMLLVLRYVHGLDSDELAVVFGCTAAAARQRLSRACRRLAQLLDEDGRPANGHPRSAPIRIAEEVSR